MNVIVMDFLGQGAEAIRDWLRTSARRCEKRVIGGKQEKGAAGEVKKRGNGR